MGIFKRKEPDLGFQVRGGCAEHKMRGPYRDSMSEADADVKGHRTRMARDPQKCRGYIEAGPDKKK